MSLHTQTESLLARLQPSRETVVWGTPLVLAEVVAVVAYAMRPDIIVTNPTFLVIPFVWINVSLWAVLRTQVPATSTRNRALAAGIGVGYLLLLSWVGGLFTLGAMDMPGLTTGLSVTWDVPLGWGPVVNYTGEAFMLTVIPYQAIGYATLAYLVYVTVVDAAGSAITGIVGLFSCVSCTWPIVATVVSGVFGSTSAVAAMATSQTYELSTLVFLTAVALLLWRPSF
ncbi:hypothetical protein ACFQH6_08705 [Halobacteriaceae archaeon GCM10025711]